MTTGISISQQNIGDTRWCLTVTIDRRRVSEFKEWLAENCPDCFCKIKNANIATSPHLSSYINAYKKGILIYELRGGNPTDAFLIKLYWS